MQSWEAMQPTANYDQHNNWYNSMFAAQIKTEPDTTPSPPLTVSSATSQLEQYLNMKHQERQQQTVLDTLTTTNIMSPSSNNTNGNNETMQHFYESNLQQQQCLHQHQNAQQQQHQQYQQQFQAAQQAAAQSQTTQMPLGFNPLTPPGLPNAVLPSMPHFYSNHSNIRQNPQTLTPVSPAAQPQLAQTPCDSTDKIQTSLTPRSTPPMDITPPKSPKSHSTQPSEQEKDQDAMSNSSEDLKYMVESEDDESIRMPIYNSHGKMKNYKCKSCGLVAITKVAFWEHARSHMKPDKILQCPKCPFVTELKHHLEYHIRKHKNLKPFQCDKCSYSCVNKSMLNSHRKSHSSVYQYRCADCDYATKYCHSFKLHLRKYDHKPGLVLDEEGLPNPSIIIDVYGTRRGPKSKSGGSSNSLKRHASSGSNSERPNNVAKVPSIGNNTSQLSAALQGFPPSQHQMATSPAKSNCSSTSERTSQHHQHQQLQDQKKQQQQQQQQQKQSHQQQPTPPPMQNILNPLATIMQQNRNMAFFPYWNLNLQMLAAQQQAAVLAQLSPGMRDTAIQHLQLHHSDSEERHSDGGENDEDDRKSVDSAMDLSQGTPTKEEEEQPEEQQQQAVKTPAVVMNLKLSEEVGGNNETPLISSAPSSRRKGRVLKLEASSVGILSSPDVQTNDVHSSSADSLMDTGVVLTSATSTPPTANTSANSAASSSGNISTSSKATSTNASPETTNGTTVATKTNSSNPLGAIYECKYCDIFFKDAVLYTIHMGYHSCDDVFKCNMCGEKCDGPVGLFVHMARNAHS